MKSEFVAKMELIRKTSELLKQVEAKEITIDEYEAALLEALAEFKNVRTA